MPTLAERVAEVKAVLQQRKDAEAAIAEADERAYRLRIFDQEFERAKAVISQIPRLVEEAVWKEESSVVIMTGIDSSDIKFEWTNPLKSRSKEIAKPIGQAVLSVIEWCTSEGLSKVYIQAEKPDHETQPTGTFTRSENGLYQLRLWL